MRKFAISTVALIALSTPAHASGVVYDPVQDIQGVQELINQAKQLAHDAKEAAHWVEELAWYKQQYDQLVSTYNALAHVTDLSSAAYAVGGLTRNFMPEANAIPQLMSDAAGLWGTAGSFQSYDLYYQSHV